MLGANTDKDRKLDRYRGVSPVNYLKQDSPPLLMIQEGNDTTIPVKHAYNIKKRAEAIEAPVKIMFLKTAGHNWRLVDAEIDLSREMIIQRSVQFLSQISPTYPLNRHSNPRRRYDLHKIHATSL